MRGGVPVFVDIRPDKLNLDESLVEAAITSHTRAFVPVHYAWVSCEMDTIIDIASRHGLMVIEDAAQGIMSVYNGLKL
jgi:dTDP-4-amino-4,6-dideoxygalactose transaminase